MSHGCTGRGKRERRSNRGAKRCGSAHANGVACYFRAMCPPVQGTFTGGYALQPAASTSVPTACPQLLAEHAHASLIHLTVPAWMADTCVHRGHPITGRCNNIRTAPACSPFASCSLVCFKQYMWWQHSHAPRHSVSSGLPALVVCFHKTKRQTSRCERRGACKKRYTSRCERRAWQREHARQHASSA